MITTEEYKELVLAQQELVEVTCDLKFEYKKRLTAEENLKELLLILTGNKIKIEWADGKIKGYEIKDSETADFLNENYIKDGILQFEKVKENNNE